MKEQNMTTTSDFYPFPTPELKSLFVELENSISQEGCSDDLAVCDGVVLETFFNHYEDFQNRDTEILMTALYSSSDDEGCDHPYSVIDYSKFEALKEHFSK